MNVCATCAWLQVDPWHQCINVAVHLACQLHRVMSLRFSKVKKTWIFSMFPDKVTLLLFSLYQGYERILGNPRRPITLGLQAAGWKGLQHAPHRVKGKNHRRPLVHLYRGHQYIIDVNLPLSSSAAVFLLCTAATTARATAHFQAELNLPTLLVRSKPLNRINFQKFCKLMSLLKRVVSALQAL